MKKTRWVNKVRSIFALCFIAISATAFADPAVKTIEEQTELIAETERSARTNRLAAERVLYAAEQAINAAAIVVSTVKVDRIVHMELKRLAAGVPGARAIIVLGPDGRLLHDSYKFPVLNLDLSDRTYFKEGLTSPKLFIGQQVIGRSSGSAFVPIGKRIGELTFVAVTAPYALVDLQSECGDCWSIAVNDDGRIITMFPPEVDILPGLVSETSDKMSEDQSIVVRYKHSVFSMVWRTSPDFPFVSVSVRGLPDNSATGSVDLN